MTPPFDPAAEWRQGIEGRLRDVEDGPYYCTECSAPFNSRRAADECAAEDTKPDPR